VITYSWNVGGLGDPLKRSRVWDFIKKRTKATNKKVIWALQETHSTKELTAKWLMELGPMWNALCSHGTSTSAGVWWLTNQAGLLKSVDNDKEGRWIIVQMEDGETKQAFSNLYVPANDPTTRKNYFKHFNWDQHEQLNAIIGGDWNTVTEADGKHSVVRDWTDKVDSKLFQEKMACVALAAGCLEIQRIS